MEKLILNPEEILNVFQPNNIYVLSRSFSNLKSIKENVISFSFGNDMKWEGLRSQKQFYASKFWHHMIFHSTSTNSCNANFFNALSNKKKSGFLMLCGHFICVHIYIFTMHADSPKNDNKEEKGSLRR